MQKVRVFIEAIRTETLGFSFGKPWRHNKGAITCVLPIIYSPKNGKERQYITLVEASKVEIKDTGAINQALVINNEDKPVFIRMGHLLKGETQERCLIMSRVIMPGEKTNVDVACVHASKGIQMGTLFEPSGYAPQRDASYANMLHSTSSVSQSMSWGTDADYGRGVAGLAVDSGHRELGEFATDRADNLVAIRDKFNETIDDILKKVPLLDNQIGMALIDTKGFHSLDCFDLHESWKAVKEALVGKESMAIAQEDKSGVFEYKPEKANQTVKDVLGKGFQDRVQFSDNRSQTVTIDFDGYVGEAVILDGEAIHLLLARKTND